MKIYEGAKVNIMLLYEQYLLLSPGLLSARYWEKFQKTLKWAKTVTAGCPRGLTVSAFCLPLNGVKTVVRCEALRASRGILQMKCSGEADNCGLFM